MRPSGRNRTFAPGLCPCTMLAPEPEINFVSVPLNPARYRAAEGSGELREGSGGRGPVASRAAEDFALVVRDGPDRRQPRAPPDEPRQRGRADASSPQLKL